MRFTIRILEVEIKLPPDRKKTTEINTPLEYLARRFRKIDYKLFRNVQNLKFSL